MVSLKGPSVLYFPQLLLYILMLKTEHVYTQIIKPKTVRYKRVSENEKRVQTTCVY